MKLSIQRKSFNRKEKTALTIEGYYAKLNKQQKFYVFTHSRRVNITRWSATCVELSRDQSQILLLVPHKHLLMPSKRSGRIIQHSEILEQKIYKLLGWQEWSSWDSCSKSCNGGIQERTRTCEGGRNCEGRGREGRVCNTFSCEGILFFK